MILSAVAQAVERTGAPVETILAGLGLSSATYHRWLHRAAAGQLADRTAARRRQPLLPTPVEVAAVCAYAGEQPAMGYKRLAWAKVDQNVACLRLWQAYRVLSDQRLLRRRVRPEMGTWRRPSPADRPDQVWHVDLMYVYVRPRWYYLVDVLDAYSRHLVHWTLNATVTADSVTFTM